MSELAPEADPSPLRSVHTASFPRLLEELRCSLLVTTYQAGKLILVRNDKGVLNTQSRKSSRSPFCRACIFRRSWNRRTI